MSKLKTYGMFALGVIAVLLVVRIVKPMLPANVAAWLP